jgi:hypothetical protein
VRDAQDPRVNKLSIPQTFAEPLSLPRPNPTNRLRYHRYSSYILAMTDTVRRLAKLPKKEQQSVLFHFPPELMRILFVEVYDVCLRRHTCDEM